MAMQRKPFPSEGVFLYFRGESVMVSLGEGKFRGGENDV
ncbi:hypothetical protein SAMN05444972_10316 [Marininema halotolerans]|uniref:Uncharacterized protein n=1 Tax=Marininema halotolerans TaxID=1155944 RepID=A0A1I6QAW9_9BACL|nr:hypothetical protein SAMN05444972_10316 [Marininema halotolerans]